MFFLAYLTANGCSNSSSSEPSSRSDKTVAPIGEVLLVTGEAEKQVTWRIKELQRKKNYFNTSLELIEGDAILLRGEVIEASKTPWLRTEGPRFELQDTDGRLFEKQLVMIEGNGFDFYFSLSIDGSYNENIKTGSDLVVVDPDSKLRNLPGHETGLSSFGKI
jgi:hypothetical protein